MLLASAHPPSCRSVHSAYQGIAEAWLAAGGGESRVAGLFDVYRVGGVRRACRRPKSEQSPAGVAAAALHITHSD